MTGPAGAWSTEQLQRLDGAVELEVALRRPDGGLGRWTPVWVVRYVDAAYRSKYGGYGETTVGAMVSVQARETTLRLDPR